MTSEKAYEFLYGIHSVEEAIKSARREVKEVIIAKGKSGFTRKIESLMRTKNIVIRFSDRDELRKKIGSNEHQGIIAIVSPYVYATVDEILEAWAISGRKAFFLILDSIEDPQNLGAISRSALLTGVQGIFVPVRRSARVSPSVCRTSAGAVEHLKIAMVKNLNNLISQLKKHDIYIVGLSEDGETELQDIDMKRDIALVIGGESRGISYLVKKNCDSRARIPVFVSGFSYNASVAGGIAMYEVVRQRR